MAIKEGLIVYSHIGTNLREGVRITRFGCMTLEEALAYCRGPPSSDLAEIRYGRYEDDGWNKKIIGTPKLIGVFKKTRYRGNINYTFTTSGVKYSVTSNGTLDNPTKARKKTDTAHPFGL